MKATLIGGVVDNARVRWQKAEAEASAARAAALGNPDPEASRRANALTKAADDLLVQLRLAEAASEEARLTPIRTINVTKMREQRLGTTPSFGTVMILLSPLVLAGTLAWWRSR